MNPFLEMITKIRNAYLAKKEIVKVVSTRLNIKIVDLLVQEGYLEGVIKKGRGIKKYLEIKLAYKEGVPNITKLGLVSKPGRRVYKGAQEIRRVRNGYGMSLVSTSHGLLTDKEARAKKLGGEVLLEVY
ncbi:MAG: 30S ribosomal protein S8 [Parcubacteria group bacterium]|nr:30S ribosomal protein S8 [Parcubacteria group bacterium]